MWLIDFCYAKNYNGGEQMSKDTITKKYMRNPDIFADFFNGFIYGGNEVIKSDDLSEVDTTNIALIPSVKGSKPLSLQRYRDILKKTVLMQSDRAYYLFLGIENQSDIHYAMPVRNMLYDALVYNQQVEMVTKFNRDNGLRDNSAEFLSGFTKNDKLIPVVTATVYWGDEPWDAPTSLKEMLLGIDKEIDRFVCDYDCNLFSIIDAQELPSYKTELNELFGLLKVRNNGEAIQKLLLNNKKYENISKETALIMREYTNIKLPRKTKEGKYNMCKGILDLQEKYQKLGEEKGIQSTILNMLADDVPDDKIILYTGCDIKMIEELRISVQ